MEKIKLIRAGGRDPRTGDWVEPEGDPVELPVWSIEPRSSSDVDTLGRQGYRDGWTVYAPPLPAGVEVASTDRFEVRGEVYELDGMPGEWVNGLAPGVFDGVVIVLKKGVG